MSEVWKCISGYEGYYEVSNAGGIRSVDRVVQARDGRAISLKGKARKVFPDAKGYRRVVLVRDGKHKTLKVHRLVLEAFVGPCPSGMVACHNDGDPSNNRVENLRWDTKSANQLDRVRHGRHHQREKTHCPLGHELVFPNLVRSFSEREGWRICRACDNERGLARKWSRPFSSAGADRRYKEIMREVEHANLRTGS